MNDLKDKVIGAFPVENRGWYAIEGEPISAATKSMSTVEHIDRLSITHAPQLTVKLARNFRALRSVSWIWLWCDVTRTAMRHIVQIPGLQTIDLLNLKSPGKLEGFANASSLRTFRANNCLTEQDVLEVCQCQTLSEMGIQGTQLTPKVVSALMSLRHLRSLDIEGCGFDDRMAEQIATSRVLDELDIGGARITKSGLQKLVAMKQLRSLDLWATKLSESDLELLVLLPQLEYVSLGNYEGLPSLNGKMIVQLLSALPSLKRVWLDGISISKQQKSDLESKLESLRIT